MSKSMPQPLTHRHFGWLDGKWFCVHPEDAPNHYYVTLSVYQGKSEMDRLTVEQAAAQSGIRLAIVKEAFSKPAPKPGDFKPAKAEKAAEKVAKKPKKGD